VRNIRDIPRGDCALATAQFKKIDSINKNHIRIFELYWILEAVELRIPQGCQIEGTGYREPSRVESNQIMLFKK